jgi:hypothetical protein
MTPFQMLYGCLPPTIPIYHGGLSHVEEVDQNFMSRDELLRLLNVKYNL